MMQIEVAYLSLIFPQACQFDIIFSFIKVVFSRRIFEKSFFCAHFDNTRFQECAVEISRENL